MNADEFPALTDLESINARIRACREELSQLKKLHRAALALVNAEKARRSREAMPPAGRVTITTTGADVETLRKYGSDKPLRRPNRNGSLTG